MTTNDTTPTPVEGGLRAAKKEQAQARRKAANTESANSAPAKPAAKATKPEPAKKSDPSKPSAQKIKWEYLGERGKSAQTGTATNGSTYKLEPDGEKWRATVEAKDGEAETLVEGVSINARPLQWNGIAFEPNPSAFEVLRANRSCRLIQGCAYYQDGQVSFLALSEREQRKGTKARPPRGPLSMVFDPTHGGAMLSGIPEHMNQLQWVESIRKPMKLNQIRATVPCHRIDTVLNDSGVKIVDYLSIDVEGAELEVLRGIDFERVQVNIIGVEHNHTFAEVYDLLTTSGFEYQGLLFFDEIFAHKRLRYSWDV